MRLKTAALLASVWLASSGVAQAQVDLGNEVTVNPIAGGGGVLLYPGGQYMRVVPPLLQPGQSPRGGVIHLHMPGKHSARVATARAHTQTRTASAAPAASSPSIPGYTPLGADTSGAEAPAPKPKRAQAPKPAPASKTVAAAAPPPQSSSPGTFGAGVPGLASGSLLPNAPAPATRVAKAEPPPANTMPALQEAPTPGLTKRSVILFAPQASDPAQSALGAIKFLAGDLNTAMTGPAARIQILAYGGAHGDKGSDARRLSLKRALAIRQVLIDDGVSPERIDVRAMGGADDSGPADRVDVYIKA